MCGDSKIKFPFYIAGGKEGRKVRLELVARLISKLSFSGFKIVDGINSCEKKDSREVFKNSILRYPLSCIFYKRAATFIMRSKDQREFKHVNFFR